MNMALVRVSVRLAGPIQLDYPLHLDGLLTEVAFRRLPHGRDVARSMAAPSPLPIPCAKIRVGDDWVWAASALALCDPARVSVSLTKRKDGEDLDRLTQTWTPNSGPGRNQLAHHEAWVSEFGSWLAWGNAREIRKALRLLWPNGEGHIGDRRRHGLGQVLGVVVEEIDGTARDAVMHGASTRRHLPIGWCASSRGADVYNGASLPPYWHPERQRPVTMVGATVSLLDSAEAAMANPEMW